MQAAMALTPNIRHQYIEALIRLVETNVDHTWLDAFLKLRSGGYLPGGGAGSLNDWGPSYADYKEAAWKSTLYEMLRFLYDNNLEPKLISTYKSIRFRNKIRIIRCLNCNKNYQHPQSLERHFSLDFYADNFVPYSENNKLNNLLNPEETFNSPKVINYKEWLLEKYDNESIKVYDFVSANYVCPHCNKHHAETEHDLYKIEKTALGDKTFKLVKQNAEWHDFEE
jgi:hypothetical protein